MKGRIERRMMKIREGVGNKRSIEMENEEGKRKGEGNARKNGEENDEKRREVIGNKK